MTAAFLRQAQGLATGSNMTSFESMAAQLAAVASLHGLQPGLAPFYPGENSKKVYFGFNENFTLKIGLWYGLQQAQQQQQQQQQDSPQSQNSRSNATTSQQSPSLTEPNASSSPVAKSEPPDLIAVGNSGGGGGGSGDTNEQPLDLTKPSGSAGRDLSSAAAK